MANVRTWQDLTEDQFHAIASTPKAKAIANRLHNNLFYGEEHLSIHSCPCAHMAVDKCIQDAREA